MTTTRCVQLLRHGGPEVLELAEVPTPSPGPGQVLVEVEAAGVAFADTLIRRGVYPEAPRPPLTPGYDLVGQVRQVGAGVEGIAVGQRVAALTVTGAYATHALADAARTVPLPDSLPDSPAGALPAAAAVSLVLNYVTAWQLLHRVARVREGQTVLILGGAGGVGTALLELCALAGIRAIATASGERTAQVTERGGLAVDRRTTDVAAEVERLCPGGVDATFDPVGGAQLARSRAMTRRDGTVVSYGASFAPAGMARGLVLARHGLALARARVTPGPRTPFYVIAGRSGWTTRHPEDLRTDLAHLLDLLAAGTLHPRTTTLPLEQAAEAHRRLEAGEVLGKLVLVP